MNKTFSPIVKIESVVDNSKDYKFVIRKHRDGSISFTRFLRFYSPVRDADIWHAAEHSQIGGNNR